MPKTPYPAARNMLARERAWISDNETVASSWEDVFEMRYFDSFVVKEGNVHDRRIKDYVIDRRSQLLHGNVGNGSDRQGRRTCGVTKLTIA